MEGLDAERDDGGCSADADEKRGPICFRQTAIRRASPIN